MPDTIPHTISDSVPLYIGRESVASQQDTVPVGFSDFKVLSTDSSNLFFDIDTTAFVKNSFWDGFAGRSFQSANIESVFFLLFVASFIFFAFFMRREGNALITNLKNVFSFKRNSLVTSKEQITTTEVWGEVFLILQTALISSIIIFGFLYTNQQLTLHRNVLILIFVIIFLGILLYFGIKYLMYKITGLIFPKLDIDTWVEKFLWLIEILGILFFVPAIFFIFIPESREIALISLIIIFFINKLVIFRNLLNIFVKNKIGFLYYFVYLCAVEIAPYLLIYKGAVSLINNGQNLL